MLKSSISILIYVLVTAFTLGHMQSSLNSIGGISNGGIYNVLVAVVPPIIVYVLFSWLLIDRIAGYIAGSVIDIIYKGKYDDNE